MPWADGGLRPWLSSRSFCSVCSNVPHTHRAFIREAYAASETAERQNCCVQRVGRCESTALIRTAHCVRLALLSCMHCCLHMPAHHILACQGGLKPILSLRIQSLVLLQPRFAVLTN